MINSRKRISIYLEFLQRLLYAHCDLSQQEVCNILGITPSTYSRILTGVVNPRTDTFLKLIDLFTERLGSSVVVENFARYVLYKTS